VPKKRVDAVIVFDVNVPKPRSNNCMTLESFYDRLEFDSILIDITGEERAYDDETLLGWVIDNKANDPNRHKKELAWRYCFFVTKDQDFREDSNFYKLTEARLAEDAKIVVINIPSSDDSGRALKRRKLLDVIVKRLNEEWKQRSPK